MEKSLIKTNLRSVISLVDKLRDINLQQYIKLPKIVAVGSQSSGKSSLVQQIVGLDFLPRGSGVVTRRPLQIRMVYQADLKQSYAIFQQIPKQKIVDFSKVKSSIEMLTDKVCGKNKNIIDKAIILNIYSSNCPNLTIIDLPGLTRIPMESQAENILEVTKNMIQKYMEEESTIILCVIPANQDITNDQVLHMARQIDKRGQRTIGCITKIDIMDRGTDARALLQNKGEVQLKLGFVGIKNRSQQDIIKNIKVQDSLQQQKMFFSKSPIYSSLPKGCTGTTYLVQKLTNVLQKAIISFVPTLIQKIRERKHSLSNIIKQYGKPLPKNSYERQSLIWELCNIYITQYKKTLTGVTSVLKVSDRLHHASCHINDELRNFLKQELDDDLNEYLNDQKIYFAIKKFDGINQLGFPSMNTFLFLITPLLTKLKTPMQFTLMHVCDNLTHISELICTQVAHQYIEFRQFLNNKNSQIISSFRKKSNQYILKLLESQIQGVSYQKLQFRHESQQQKKEKKKPTQLQIKAPLIPLLRRSVKGYYHLTVKNLRDLIPKNIKYLLIQQSQKKIQFQVFQSCMKPPQDIQNWLKIGDSSRKQRLKNQEQYQTVVKAEQFLLTHSGFAKFKNRELTKSKEDRQRELQQQAQKQKQRKMKKAQKQKQKNIQIEKDKNQKHINHKQQESHHQKEKPKVPHKKQQEQKKISQKEQKKQQPQQKPKTSLFQNLFGTKTAPTETKPNPSQKKPVIQDKNISSTSNKQDLKQTYNKQMGKTTDKAVDQLYKNQKFQKQSKNAVEKGASITAQKQLGVNEQQGKTIGKGVGWLFGQQAVQNHLKQETKKAARNNTQL